MSDALGVKITEVYRCCVDSHPTDLSTLEKLTSVEHCACLQLQFLESIPEENLETLRLIKDSIRRGRSVFMSLELKVDPSMYAFNERVYEAVASPGLGIRGFSPRQFSLQ